MRSPLLNVGRRSLLAALALLVLIWTGFFFHESLVPEGVSWDRLGGAFGAGRRPPGPPGPPGPPRPPGPPPPPGQPEEASIKPVAFVFPQFHPIPENDKNWGVNFTDWDNVRKVTHNNFGLETLRPTDAVGFYNLLDYDVRQRYGQLIRDMGFYGIAYHHYWFHHPVMEKVPELVLQDGQPDVPFMLSWANEPWTATWDGQPHSKVLQAQDYGDLAHWRVHFDWLLRFFQHPNYIRVRGRPQFMIYNPSGLGDLGVHMYAAFRRWAVEAGLPGLDIIETRVQPAAANNRIADAMSEFLFRSGTGLDGTEWPALERVARVYHRGASVTWDNTPRYRARGSANIFAHPTLWKLQILEIMRRMKLEPNPVGEENFFFVNALNEWGEGNVLEPSKQWDDGFSRAAREAVDDEKARLPWRHEIVDAGLRVAAEMERAPDAPVDVCVVVRMFTAAPRFSAPDTASELFDSLRAQTNPHWRAVAFRAAPAAADAKTARHHVLDAFDPRIVFADDDAAFPADVAAQEAAAGTDAGAGPGRGLFATQHVLEHLADISPACAGARYLLVTNEDTTYAPGTFDRVRSAPGDDSTPDIVGLAYITPDSMATALSPPGAAPDAWDRYCTRLGDRSVDVCAPATPDTAAGDQFLGATLLSWAKLQPLLAVGGGGDGNGSGGKPLFAWANHSATPDHAVLDHLRKAGWTWPAAPARARGACDLVAGATAFSCGRTGRIWLDMPAGGQTTYASRCMSLHSITKAHGWLVDQWDMDAWRKDPFCLRLSQARYAELFPPAGAPAGEPAGAPAT